VEFTTAGGSAGFVRLPTLTSLAQSGLYSEATRSIH
jgi:hypothetical protein